MEDALVLLRKGVVSPPDKLPDFPGIQAAVGFPEYYTEEAKYATAPRPPPQPAVRALHRSACYPQQLTGRSAANSILLWWCLVNPPALILSGV